MEVGWCKGVVWDCGQEEWLRRPVQGRRVMGDGWYMYYHYDAVGRGGALGRKSTRICFADRNVIRNKE